jgi:hypothetical protein
MPYEPLWLEFNQAVTFIAEREGRQIGEVADELVTAIRDGNVKVKWTTDISSDCAPPTDWSWFGPILGTGAFQDILVCRSDLDRLWRLRTTDDDPRSLRPSGTRTNRAAANERACGEWLAGLTERPKSKDAAFQAAVIQIGPLSRKAFDRAWASNVPPEWKHAGRRKRV